jgi:hypothetical protein
MFKFLKYIFSVALGVGILYLLFKHQDPIKLYQEIQKVDMKWVILSMVFGAWAYVDRGIRWGILLDGIGYKISTNNSISAVSIGYFTNLFIPRAGELSRCTALNQAEKIPVDKLFGTIIIERLIDLIALIVLLIITLLVKSSDILNFYKTILAQKQIEREANTTLIIVFSVIILISIATYLNRKKLMQFSAFSKIMNFMTGLKEGFNSIKKIKNKTKFWFHSFSIWIMYFLMTYICFFSMHETSHLTIGDGMFLLVLGGIGMIIPTPGGLGSYHAIMMIGLYVLGVGTLYLGEGGDSSNPALIFPTMVHVAQTLVAIILGLIGL